MVFDLLCNTKGNICINNTDIHKTYVNERLRRIQCILFMDERNNDFFDIEYFLGGF